MQYFTNPTDEMKEFYSPSFPGTFHVHPHTDVPVCDADLDKFKAENPDWPEAGNATLEPEPVFSLVTNEDTEILESAGVTSESAGFVPVEIPDDYPDELEYDKEKALTNAETLG